MRTSSRRSRGAWRRSWRASESGCTKGQPLALRASPDIGLASSDLGKADADLTIAAEHDFQRKKELFDAHAASQADYETSEDNYRKAKAEKERAYQKAFLLRSGGSTDSVSQGYTLTSPIEGELIARAVNPGIEVQGQYGGGQAVRALHGRRDWIRFGSSPMSSRWIIARVKVGAKVSVKVIAYPGKVFTGQVDWVSGALDPTSRTAKVRCTFDNPDRAPSQAGDVPAGVDLRRREEGVGAPEGAVLRLGDQTVVFVQTGKTADGKSEVQAWQIPVQKVDEGDGGQWLPVEHGLDKGTAVVTTRSHSPRRNDLIGGGSPGGAAGYAARAEP